MELELKDLTKQYGKKTAVDHYKPHPDRGRVRAAWGKWRRENNAHASYMYSAETNRRKNPFKR